jgi:choline-glycine betaine transporter
MASVKGFIVGGVIIGALIYLVFTLWVVGNSVLYSIDGGLVTELDEMAQKDMSGGQLDNWNERHDTDQTTFGFIGVVVMAVLFITFIIIAFKSRSQQDE